MKVGDNIEQNRTIAQGDVAGALTEKIVDGQTVSVTEAANTKLSSYSSMYSLGAIQWRHETDSLVKRLGELRDTPSGVGTWVRLYGSEQEYGAQNVTAKNTTIQVGVGR